MKAKTRKHILLLPFPAYGHIIPLMELGKKLAKYHNVTLAVSESITPQIIARELMSKKDFPLVGIPDGFVEIDHTNVASDANFRAMMATVIPATRRLLAAIPTKPRKFVELDALGIATPVDIVIGDHMLASALAKCHDRGIPFYFFNKAAASVMTLTSLIVDEDYPSTATMKDELFTFSELASDHADTTEVAPIPQSFKELMLAIHETNHLASGIVVNSVQDMEEDTLNAILSYPVMKNIPVRFVGPLLPSEKLSEENLQNQDKVRGWLDGKPATSVIYVSFGSIAAPTPEQITELGQALLATGRPFIWSLKAKYHGHLPTKISSQIWQQFTQPDSPFLLLPWAPQKLILQHPSTAVFLSHCGWNSTLESLAAGMPLVAWPLFGDQKVNAEWLVKRSLGVMIEGTGLNSRDVVSANEIKTRILKVGWGDKVYREAGQLWKDKLDIACAPGGSSDTALKELVEFSDNTH